MTTGALCLEHEALKLTQMDVAEAIQHLRVLMDLVAHAMNEKDSPANVKTIFEGNFVKFEVTSR